MTEVAAAKLAETAKKTAELTKDVEKAKRDVEFYKGINESRLRKGLDASSSSIDLKYAAERLRSKTRELERLR